MAPNPRVLNAFRAMKALEINEEKVKPVLKKLLKVYDKNWELIEEDNYRVLVDAIFEPEDDQGDNNNEGTQEFERPNKRQCVESPDTCLSPSSNITSTTNTGIQVKVEKGETASTCSMQIQQDARGPLPNHFPASCNLNTSGYQATSVPSYIQASSSITQTKVVKSYRTSNSLHVEKLSAHFTDPAVDGNIVVAKDKNSNAHTLLKPKDEPYTDEIPNSNALPCEIPLAVVQPDSSIEDTPQRHTLLEKTYFRRSPQKDKDVLANGHLTPPAHMNLRLTANGELASVQEESPTNMEIASSSSGEVKLFLNCNSLIGRPNFHMPNQQDLLKLMEDKCLQSYEMQDPKFSVSQLLKDMCDCFLELATHASHESQDSMLNAKTSPDLSKHRNVGNARNPENIYSSDCSAGYVEKDRSEELDGCDSCSLVVVPECVAREDLRSLHDIDDISRGREQIKVPCLNEVNGQYLPSFNYLPFNVVFCDAHANFNLSHVLAEKSCSACFGDCLSSTICACSDGIGTGFSYASNGCVNEEFLDECISMTRDPQKQCISYCRICPLASTRGEEILEPCKGHLKRKCIKECWLKCQCHRSCGNRLVQRGIKHQLQVFFTPDGKDWGLRTIEKLPKGAFVCEYTGEVLTIKELHQRCRQKSSCSMKYAIPFLDAYWNLMEEIKDEEALCIDATFHGNIARFINHRCLDANLIEIPVKMETSDHHYYHLAFFTTREVDALEELTWDYGIDFDDNDSLIEPFYCRCGSKFCRNMKRATNGLESKMDDERIDVATVSDAASNHGN